MPLQACFLASRHTADYTIEPSPSLPAMIGYLQGCHILFSELMQQCWCRWKICGAILSSVRWRRAPQMRGTPPAVLQEIIRRTGDAMSSCMQALNLGGLKLQALLDAVETR